MPATRLAATWLPVVAWAAVIFALSSIPSLGTGLGFWDLVLRKLAHMVEYGLLWFLWWRALGYGSPLAAAAIAVGYAVTDELHQTTVDGRVGSPYDVAIDALGVGLAALIASRARWR